MVKELLKPIREYKKVTWLTPFFVSLEVVLEVAITFLMARMIDLGIDAGDINYIIKLGLILTILCLISLICGIFSGFFSAKSSSGYARNLRDDMYIKIQSFSFANIDKFSSSSLITRLTTDVKNVQNAFQVIIRLAVRAPLMIIFSLIMVFSINRSLSLIFLLIIPILIVGLYFIINKVFPLFEKVLKVYDKLNNIVQENLRGIRVVKSFVREDYEKKKFVVASDKIYKYYSRAEKIISFSSPLMQFCIYTSMLLISWFGARLIVNNSLTTGQLMSLIIYAMQILVSLMLLSIVFVMIIMSRSSAKRIIAVLKEKVDIKNGSKNWSEVKDGSISFKNVSFSYTNDQDKLCLRQVNLEIKSAWTVGIIGGTGSSKTTLVQLIPRLYDATEGQVLVGGVNVKDYNLKVLRDQVAIILQKNVLFSGSVKENLLWGNYKASDEELQQVCRIAQADEFIQQLPEKYDTKIEQGGNNLSGGQKQRLCLARALLKNPKILIFDDATSAVDTKTEKQMEQALKEYLPQTTKLIITQRIASIESADLIMVLDNGQINGLGRHEELLKNNSIYKEIYKSQQEGGLPV